MWNKRSSFFLLVSIRHKNRRFILPISLFVLEDILASLHSWIAFCSRLFPWLERPALVTALSLELLQELRRLGSWPLAEIHNNQSLISIKLF